MYHSFFKISRNIDSYYRQACREVHGILETSIVQESRKKHVPHVLSGVSENKGLDGELSLAGS